MNNISADISMCGQKLEELTSFKYLGAILYKDGTCSVEVRIRISSAMAAMARLNSIWRCSTISFAGKFKLYKSLVTSILCGCETRTLLADSEKEGSSFRNQVPEATSPHLHKTNDWVWSKINFLVSPQEPLLATVKRRKLEWFGHVTRHDSLYKTILQGTLEGGRRLGRQRKC